MLNRVNEHSRQQPTYEEAMMVWRARDASRARTALATLFYSPFVLVAVGGMLSGHWGLALLAVACPWLVLQIGRVAWRGLARGWHRLTRRLHATSVGRVIMSLGILLSLAGCMDTALWWANAQGIKFDGDHACTADRFHDGHCAPLTATGGGR